MKTKISSGLFKRLLIVSCLIGTLPILLLGALSYYKSSSVLQKEVAASNELILQQNKAKIEYVLKTVDTLTTQTIITPVTTNEMLMQNVLELPFTNENRDVFQKLVHSLSQMQVYELGIFDVKLVSYRQEWMVDRGAVYLMHNRPRVDSHDDVLQDAYRSMLEARGDGRSSNWTFEPDESGKGYVVRLNKSIPLNAINPYGMLSVYIPLSELGDRLSGDEAGGHTYVVTKEGRIVAGLSREDTGMSIADAGYYRRVMESDALAGSFPYKDEAGRWLVQFQKAQYNDWTYISLTSMERLMNQSNRIKWYTTFSAGVLILLVVLVSFLFSDRIYLPIGKLYRAVSEDEPDADPNEIHAISKRLANLMLSKKELNAQVDRLHRQAQEFFVYKLLSGQLQSSVVHESLERMHLPADWGVWSVVSLSLDNRERKFSPDDYDLMMFAVCNIIDETIPGANHLPPIYHDQMVHLLFGCSDEANVPFNIHLYNAMEMLRGNIETYLKLGVHIGISREYRDWSFASRALQESEHALYYRDRLDDVSILFIKEVEPGEARGFRYPKELEFQLEQAIRRCDAVQAEAALRELVRSVYARALHRSDSQHALDRLFNQLSGLIQEKNESITSVLEFYRIPEKFFDRPHSPDAIEHWLMQHLVRPLIRWSEEQSEKSDIAISACIIQEIEKHYDQDLTIEWFAQRLNYHPSYISRVFRKDTGMTFSDYLSNYRIEKAKEMLAHSNMKIADIAEKLRYSTPSNFNRHFKKVVQLTPSQYREQAGGGR